MRMLLQVAMLTAGGMTAGLGTAAPSAAAAPAAQYRLVLGPADTSQYLGIDAGGDIIGVGVDAALFGRQEGFIIKAGTTTPIFLADPGTNNQNSMPRSINDQGVAVGNYQKNEVVAGGEAEITRPAIWPGPGSSGSDLGVDPTGTADACGINDQQQIVGTQGGNVDTPWLQQGGTVTNLPTFPGGKTAEALAINDSGVVVGDAAQTNGHQPAAEWVNGTISSLGTLNGGSIAEALAVNSSGQAVGAASAPGSSTLQFSHAVLFSNGRAVDLDVPGAGQGAAHATAINTSGVIVGDDGIDPDLVDIGNGFIYRNGHATELNTLIAPTPNVRLAGATGINDAGDIVGTAVLTASDGTETDAGYELVPIPTT
jgi:probable HAF family extracellular repeat protein